MLCPGHCPHSPAAQQSPRGPRQHYPPAKKRLWPSGAPDLSLHHGQLGSGTRTSWGRRWRFWTCLATRPARSLLSPFLLAPKLGHAHCKHVYIYAHTRMCMYNHGCTHILQVVLVSGTKIFGEKAEPRTGEYIWHPRPSLTRCIYFDKGSQQWGGK